MVTLHVAHISSINGFICNSFQTQIFYPLKQYQQVSKLQWRLAYYAHNQLVADRFCPTSVLVCVISPPSLALLLGKEQAYQTRLIQNLLYLRQINVTLAHSLVHLQSQPYFVFSVGLVFDHLKIVKTRHPMIHPPPFFYLCLLLIYFLFIQAQSFLSSLVKLR